MPISNAINAKSLTLGEEKIVPMLWMKLKTKDPIMPRNLFALIAAKSPSKIVPNMEKTLFSSSVSFVAPLLSGFAGAILTFVNHVTRGSVKVTMWVSTQKISYQNAKVQESVR